MCKIMKPIIFADDEHYFHVKISEGIRSRLPNVSLELVWSGEELVEKVLSGEYGVIVTDYQMGRFKQNGIEAAQLIRDKEIKTPIFIYSTHEMPSEVLSGKPIDRAFQKESDFERLLDEVALICRNEN